MSQSIYHMPLAHAIKSFTMAELVAIFSKSSPAFLAAVVKAKSQEG